MPHTKKKTIEKFQRKNINIRKKTVQRMFGAFWKHAQSSSLAKFLVSFVFLLKICSKDLIFDLHFARNELDWFVTNWRFWSVFAFCFDVRSGWWLCRDNEKYARQLAINLKSKSEQTKWHDHYSDGLFTRFCSVCRTYFTDANKWAFQLWKWGRFRLYIFSVMS